ESAANEYGVAIAKTADGGFVVAARLEGGAAGARIGLFRLDRVGNHVTNFGNNGKVFKDAWLSWVSDMAIDAQGRIVVLGSSPPARARPTSASSASIPMAATTPASAATAASPSRSSSTRRDGAATRSRC